ncbi:LysR family transcriptional regulator [Gordonia amarae]|uniref:LysR family transcriptional regulator n=2 Tax=Gordonia amarae TaxID=36821 RepID=A0A857MFB4_9ACTN|nr:LysR family transcriptional regulator [Gordonia amarae]MCS3877258.1 DNA-binding transcriptional LysR family regulator [Gordonia amarae]QHN16031.1 LysR family transcriptional regulator [Gordonia amarae]QHN20599.1 LysR family transcriptional regulator [Gordonia amarae]QHN29451.1 LysR family transcriptional regulator [Gordonia amarae]QHN38227.1 LysR family transcriptional regulator [Gordonia amarae]
MEIRQTEYFLAVVDNQGVSGAATALGISEPTVSQALRTLERELGIPLFHRVGRGMVPTAAGRRLIGPARQLLRDVRMVGQLQGSGGGLAGRLDILAFPATVSGQLTDLLAEFCVAHPSVPVRLGLLDAESEVDSMIAEGHCEFVVCTPRTAGDRLTQVEIGEQEYVVVYPAGTDVPAEPIPLSDLPPVPMTLASARYTIANEISTAMPRGSGGPPVAAITDHPETRLAMVRAGMGGTVMERAVAETAGDAVDVYTASPRFAYPLVIAFDEATLSPAGQAFVAIIRGAL